MAAKRDSKRFDFSNVFPDTLNFKKLFHRVASIEVSEYNCIGIVNVILDEYFQCDSRIMKVELLNEMASHGIFLLLLLLYVNEACGNCSPFYSERYK